MKQWVRLPVSVCNYKFGDGIVKNGFLPSTASETTLKKLEVIDSIALDGIAKKAFPGCVVMAAHKGEILYHKAFGNYEYGPSPKTTVESIFDLASVTKISATTVSIMKLYEQGKVELNKTIGDYLPWTKGSDKAGISIKDILLHQAGLYPYIVFYKETIDTNTGIPLPGFYSEKSKPGYTVRVAENMYMRNDWQDTMWQRILQSKVSGKGKYVYSDNDFIFFGKIVEAVTGMTLHEYATKTFYNPMGMVTTGFSPRNRFPVDRLVPTETEAHFRRQTMRGDVHDEGASMFGGVAGHAGLFSNAYDLSMLYQMLLNGGVMNGERYLKPETIKLFTAYNSDISRRGLGFDKPEKDNATREEPYPSHLLPPEGYGHTGFTGTCVWVDPVHDLVFVFLSNRVNPTRNSPKLSSLNIRGNIQDALIKAVEGE